MSQKQRAKMWSSEAGREEKGWGKIKIKHTKFNLD
jgi:hypothetical protein